MYMHMYTHVTELPAINHPSPARGTATRHLTRNTRHETTHEAIAMHAIVASRPRTLHLGSKAAARAVRQTFVTRSRVVVAPLSRRAFQSTTPVRQPKNQVYYPYVHLRSLFTHVELQPASTDH
jgi:hypothetical protein